MYLDAKFGGHKETSEYFQTAGRSIKTGLISGSFPAQFLLNGSADHSTSSRAAMAR